MQQQQAIGARSSLQNATSVLTLGEVPQTTAMNEEMRAKSQNLEDEAHKLNAAISRLHETPNVISNSSPLVAGSDQKPGLDKANPASTSHGGLYGLNERDNWLLSKEPVAQGARRI